MAKVSNKFEIEKRKKVEMINEIILYFKKERDEEIGELSAELFLDFFIKKIAPEFYNIGIQDAMAYMNQSVEDMAGLEKY